MSALRWHVVNTYAGAEWDCHHGLLSRGYHSRLPAVLSGSRRGRWNQGVLRPMFPGYLFVGLFEGQGIEKAETAPGYHSFLRYSDRRLIAIKEDAMTRLFAQAEEALRESFGVPVDRHDWQPGDWCSVPYGPLIGRPAQIEDIDKQGNVRAYLGTLPVTFHVTALPAAEKRAYSVRGSAKRA